LRSHWPLSLSKLLAILSLVFLTMMCVASATRVGYVIYPLNFSLWSWACRDVDVAPEDRVLQTVSEF
jgi:hypothetical protein